MSFSRVYFLKISYIINNTKRTVDRWILLYRGGQKNVRCSSKGINGGDFAQPIIVFYEQLDRRFQRDIYTRKVVQIPSEKKKPLYIVIEAENHLIFKRLRWSHGTKLGTVVIFIHQSPHVLVSLKKKKIPRTVNPEEYI